MKRKVISPTCSARHQHSSSSSSFVNGRTATRLIKFYDLAASQKQSQYDSSPTHYSGHNDNNDDDDYDDDERMGEQNSALLEPCAKSRKLSHESCLVNVDVDSMDVESSTHLLNNMYNNGSTNNDNNNNNGWRELIECFDVWSVIIKFLPTHDWIHLSYTCRYMNNFKHVDMVMIYKKRSLKRFLNVGNGAIWNDTCHTIYSLDLNGNVSVTDECFSKLQNLLALSMFSYNYKNITEKAFKCLKNLRYLDISWSGRAKITDAALSHLPNLQILDMSGCEQKGLTDAVFAHLPMLHTLSISRCGQITNRAFRFLTNLRVLDMSYCAQKSISNEAFTYLRNLQSLNMKGCQTSITDEIFWGMRGTLRRLVIDQRLARAEQILNGSKYDPSIPATNYCLASSSNTTAVSSSFVKILYE